MAFSCQYCTDFRAPSERLLFNHIRLVHADDPVFNIQCPRKDCLRTFRNFRTYQNHMLRHRKQPRVGEDSNLDSNLETESDEDTSENEMGDISFPGLSKAEVQSFAVKWILKTRETRDLTRVATQGIIQDVQDIVDLVTQSLRSRTRSSSVQRC